MKDENKGLLKDKIITFIRAIVRISDIVSSFDVSVEAGQFDAERAEINFRNTVCLVVRILKDGQTWTEIFKI